MKRGLMIVGLVLVLAACAGTPAAPEPTPDPVGLVAAAAQTMRGASTFRMIVDQQGPDYAIPTDFGNVNFRRADAVYLAPDTMQAAISVTALGGVRVDIEVFARGAAQWFRSPVWTAGNWINAAFAPGFNPAALIAEETGFNAALSAVIDLEYAGETTLEDGQPVRHVRGRADAVGVNALLIGLISMTGEIGVDVYINRETGYPARFVLTEPVASASDSTNRAGAARVWLLDILDIDQPVDLDAPAATTDADAAATADIVPTPAAFIGAPGS